jgi:hypothetical protein
MQGELIKAERVGDTIKIVALLSDFPPVLDKVASLAGKEVSVTITEPKQKRSINANDYFWLIVGKIADKMRTSKDEIYLKMLQRYGQHIVVTVKTGYDISKAGFKYYEKLRDGLINGKEFTAWRIFIGSSQYSKEEMSVLIDGAVSEAKELGIDVELQDYISLME